MMRNIFALALIAVCLAFAMAGCQKEGCTDSKASNYDPDAKKDNGTCVYTTPQPDPVEPTKVITLDWNWATPVWRQLSRDTIEYYAAQSDVKTIILNLDNNVGDESTGLTGPETSANKTPYLFHRICDSLSNLFDVSDKTIGMGTIYVGAGGAHLSDPNDNFTCGMTGADSTRFAQRMGYEVRKFCK